MSMKKKYTFPEPGCRGECPHFNCVGSLLNETCYCMKASKKGKRFKRGASASKPPKWCPRRYPAPVCRIYSLRDPFYEALERESRERFDPDRQTHYFPCWHRYQLRCEADLHMGAKQFFEAAQDTPLEELLHTRLSLGEIVEIDDGLKPYFFYCYATDRVIPAMIISRERR